MRQKLFTNGGEGPKDEEYYEMCVWDNNNKNTLFSLLDRFKISVVSVWVCVCVCELEYY